MPSLKNISFRLTLSFGLIMLLFNLSAAQEKQYKNIDGTPALRLNQNDKYTQTLCNISNWLYWISCDGRLAWNPVTNSAGGVYPRGTAIAVYADGVIWGGYARDGKWPALRVGGSRYRTGLQPGWVEGQIPIYIDHPRARIYRIRRDWPFLAPEDVRQEAAEHYDKPAEIISGVEMQAVLDQYAVDWAEWPGDLGAPFIDKNGNDVWDGSNIDQPGLFSADQIIWFVANDFDEAATNRSFGSPPIGLEMQVTIWAYKEILSPLGQTIYKRYRLINKSGSPIDSMFIGQFSDPDIGDYGDDYVGCYPADSYMFAYNSSPVDDIYFKWIHLMPPAIGYKLIQGPVVHSPGDTAIYNFQKIADYKNQQMTSFGYSVSGMMWLPPIGTYGYTLTLYNELNGYLPTEDTLNPVPYTYGSGPEKGQPTKFPANGDPFTDPYGLQGDVDGQGLNMPPGDRRVLLSSGPFKMAAGDTQEIIIAVIGGLGDNNLHSTKVLKDNAAMIDQPSRELLKLPVVAHQVHYPNSDSTTLQIAANLHEFTAVQSCRLELRSIKPYISWGLTLPLADDGADGDTLANDGIWSCQVTISNQKYPCYGNLYVTDGEGTWNYPEIYSGLPLRPRPSFTNWRVVWENGQQDRKVNPCERVLLAFDLINNDEINGVDSIRINHFYATYEPQDIRLGLTLAAGDTLRDSRLCFDLTAGGDADSLLIDFWIWLDYGYTHILHKIPIEAWTPLPGWRRELKTLALSGFSYNVRAIVADPALLNGHSYLITFFEDSLNNQLLWRLTDQTAGVIKLDSMAIGKKVNDPYPVVDGIEFKVFEAPKDFVDFQIVANAAGPIIPPSYGAFRINDSGFPTTLDGNPEQPSHYSQTNGSLWGIHSAKFDDVSFNFDFFKRRVLRYDNLERCFPYDYELRFTNEGSLARMAFTTGNTARVPFELWNIGQGTPDESADDYQMIPYIYDQDDNDAFNLCHHDHPISDGNDDPETDWIYWRDAIDKTPGSAGYQKWEASGSTADVGPEIMARMVLVNLDGGDVSSPNWPNNLNATMPEQGTIFRILTGKPITENDSLLVNAVVGLENTANLPPQEFLLEQNYPNPFNPATNIRFALAQNVKVKLEIFDVLGRKISTLINQPMSAGRYNLHWPGLNDKGVAVASGVYFYRLTAGEFTMTKKMLLLR